MHHIDDDDNNNKVECIRSGTTMCSADRHRVPILFPIGSCIYFKAIEFEYNNNKSHSIWALNAQRDAIFRMMNIILYDLMAPQWEWLYSQFLDWNTDAFRTEWYVCNVHSIYARIVVKLKDLNVHIAMQCVVYADQSIPYQSLIWQISIENFQCIFRQIEIGDSSNRYRF